MQTLVVAEKVAPGPVLQNFKNLWLQLQAWKKTQNPAGFPAGFHSGSVAASPTLRTMCSYWRHFNADGFCCHENEIKKQS